MSRSQLRVHICQTRKSDRQEWQSLVVLNGTKIFLNGTNISFLKFICGILNRGVAKSFWNHVIQISSRQMHFQDTYIFQSVKSKSIYWKYLLLKIKYIFLRDSYVCTRWIFIFNSDQAQINSVEYYRVCPHVCIGTPAPLPQASVSPLLRNQRGGGETHSPVGEEWGSQFGRLEKKPTTMSTLWLVLSV